MNQGFPNIQKRIDVYILSRAQGCLLGQLAGDALGSLVEFQTPESILRKYPGGVRKSQWFDLAFAELQPTEREHPAGAGEPQ